LLFLAGFTQALSLLQSTLSNPTFSDILKFIFKRILKIFVIYLMNLLFIVFLFRQLPSMTKVGGGPTWHFFDDVMKPCD
jgi:peptidoglycan/LPS O-acetylase OafA/YrhL